MTRFRRLLVMAAVLALPVIVALIGRADMDWTPG